MSCPTLLGKLLSWLLLQVEGGQAGELSDAFGQAAQLVVTQVEGGQAGELSDAFGQAAQLVVLIRGQASSWPTISGKLLSWLQRGSSW